MAADQHQDTSAERAAEKSSENGAESSPMKADEVMKAQADRADMYKSDMEERKEQYQAGLSRGTSSEKVLDRLSIVDEGVSLTRKPGRAADARSGAGQGSEKMGIVVEDKSASGAGQGSEKMGIAVEDKSALDTSLEQPPAPTDGAFESGAEAKPEAHPESQIESSRVTRDDHDRPAKIEYPDGSTNRVEYDEGGNVTKLHARDSSTFTREGDHWIIATDGKASRWDGEIYVTEEGDIASRLPDGRTKVRGVDGSETIIEPGKGQMTTNLKGEVTSVTYPDGTTNKIEYDENGNVTKIQARDGSTIEREGEHWRITKGGETAFLDGDINVTKEGDIYSVADDGSIQIRHRDGSETVTHHDQSQVCTNSERKVTSITRAPDLKTTTIEYGRDGEPRLIKNPDGTNWLKQGPYWNRYDQKGNRVEQHKGDIEVTESGDISMKKSDGSAVVHHLDGSKTDVPAESTPPVAKPAEQAVTGGDAPPAPDAVKAAAEKAAADSKDLSDDDLKAAAIAVHKALEGPEPDSDAICKLLEDKNEAERHVIAQMYEAEYGEPLRDVLAARLSGVDLDDAMRVLDRKDGEVVDRAAEQEKAEEVDRLIAKDQQKALEEAAHRIRAETAAISSRSACKGGGTDEAQIYDTLRGLNDEQRKLLIDVYRELYAIDLEEQLVEELEGPELDRALCLLNRKDADFNVEGVDAVAMAQAAEGIYKALDGLNDVETVKETLKGRNEAEKEMIDAFFRIKYGMTLDAWFKDQLEGSELDRVVNLFHKKDGSADDAGRIHSALIEHAESGFGARSDEMCEKDIRDTLATMNSDQIAQLEKEYRERYNLELRDVLLNDSNLSEATKKALEIYFKGTDERTDEDTLHLAEIALEAEDIQMFQEAMRGASEGARTAFLLDNGAEKLEEKFGGNDLIIAYDYMLHGELTTAHKIFMCGGVFNDSETGIEGILANMTPAERRAFRRGRELTNDLAHGRVDEDSLSERDKKALETYSDIHRNLQHWADNEDQLTRWLDMALKKGGTLVTKVGEFDLADLGRDDPTGVYKAIEDMSLEDWKMLKDPIRGAEYRQRIEDRLKDFLSDDQCKRAMDLLDRKKKTEKYEDTQHVRRPVLDALADVMYDSIHWYGVNVPEEEVYRVVAQMTPEEQERYRGNPEFKKHVDDCVTALLMGAEEDAALAILGKIERKEPTDDIVTKLYIHASYTDTDEAQVIRDVQAAFRADPSLRERINNPQTEEQGAFAEQFKKALSRALGSSDYETYGRPLLETGHLAIELQMELNKGFWDADELGCYRDILNATPDERKEILSNPEYREQVLGFLSDEEQEIALSILKQADMLPDNIANASPEVRAKILDRMKTDEKYREQILGHLSDHDRLVAFRVLMHGPMLPEDMLRAQMVGAGTGAQEIKNTLSQLTPPEINRVMDAYARKYSADLTFDLIDELGGHDKIDAVRKLREQPITAREAFNQARDEYYESRSGIDATISGTGKVTDDAIDEFAAQMSKYSAKFKELPPAKQRELTENLQKALEVYRQSKGEMADGLIDATLAIAAVVGAPLTEGASLSLLAAVGSSAAMFKVAAKAILMGPDYDWGSDLGMDLATGFVDGFFSFAGPGEIAAVLKIGEKSALTAARLTAEKLAAVGGKELVKGGEEALEKALTAAVRDAIVSGKYEVSEKVLDDMVLKLAREGAPAEERALLKQTLKESIAAGMKQEVRAGLEKLALEYGLNVGGGAVGGGASGMVRGFAEWDGTKSFGDNLATVGKMAGISASFGAGGAAAFTTVFKVGGSMYHGITEHFNVRPGEKLSEAQIVEITQSVQKEAGDQAKVKVTQEPDGDITVRVENAKPRTIEPRSGGLKTGDSVSVNGTEAEFIGADPDGDLLIVRRKDAPPLEGPGTEVTPEQLESNFKQVGDSDYYTNGDGNYYKLRENPDGRKELVQDWDLDFVPPKDVELPKGEAVPERVSNQELLNNWPADLAQLKPHEREALLRHMETHPMNRSEVIGTFTEKGHKVMAEWDKLTPKQRGEELQRLMNEMAREKGFPVTEVVVATDAAVPVAYSDGRIVISEAALAGRDPQTILKQLFHESIHAEQDSLVIRKLADELKIGKNASPEDIDKLQKLYKERTNVELPDNKMKTVLEARDGKALAPDELARANDIEKAFKDYPWHRPDIIRVQEEYGEINRCLTQLDNPSENPNAPEDLIVQLSEDNGTLTKKLFGTEEMPPKVKELVQAMKRGEELPEGADKLLKDALAPRRNETFGKIHEAYVEYEKSLLEQEAYVLEKKVELYMKKLAQPGESAHAGEPPSPDKPDAAQAGIRDGKQLKIPDPDSQRLQTGGSSHEAYRIEIRQSDGTVKEIVFHPNELGDSDLRLRNDKAAYKLNQMIGLDNGFPATVERSATVPAQPDVLMRAETDPALARYRTTGTDGNSRLSDEGLRVLEEKALLEPNSLSYDESGQLVRNAKGWAQEFAGEDFQKGLEALARERYGDQSEAAIARLLKDDPELRKAVETAMVERMLAGDVDFRDGNFRLVKNARGKYEVVNIDLDHAFKDNQVPEVSMPADVGVTRQLAEQLAEQPLSPELRAKIKSFVEHYDTPAGREELAKLGFTPEEVDAYLARAQHLADTGKFPHVEPAAH